MKETEQSILQVFKANPSKELSTSFLAKQIFSEEYQEADDKVLSTDKQTITEGKRKKFELHRKLLYYLNKLIEEKILKITRTEEKGEKLFALTMEEGDIVLEKGYKKIIITKPNLATTQIDLYENQKIMKKYQEDSWISRLNSIMLECSKIQGINKLHSIIKECFSNINDSIALHNFELIINALNENNEDELKTFLERINTDTRDFDKVISILIDAETLNDKNAEKFIFYFSEINPAKINIVFSINNKELLKHSHFFEYVIEHFSKNKIKLNIKNKDISTAPFFKGRAGMYSFDEEDWNVYKNSAYGKVLGVSCSQSAIAVNINKFFEIYKTDHEFRQAILNVAKALLSANTIQRRKSTEYFRNIEELNAPDSAEFYKFSRNYIRFWNYDWHSYDGQDNNLFDLIKSTKEVVDAFCFAEETIFKSCGIPIRFKIAFSSAFRNFDPNFMGEKEYKKANLRSIEDFYKGEIKKFIYVREKMFEIFDGGDRLRIFRAGEFKNLEIVRELSMILSTFKIPFFTYDFSELKGTIKLTNFMN